MPLDLSNALAVAEVLARRAGLSLREGLHQPRHIDYKGVLDLVTDYDRAAEALISSGLREAFPAHGLVGEEGTRVEASEGLPDYCWYIDPLDGTSNFAHGIPHFAVSIALAGPDKTPLLGVVYDPNRDECFKGIKGQGATLNDQPIHVSLVADLTEAALSTGFPRDRWTNPDNNTAPYVNFLLRAQSASRFGSAALDLSYVAAGRFDGFWQMKMKPWDVMAGLLFVTEAGGQISNYQAKMEGVYEGLEVVASNRLIHERMLNVIVLGSAAPRPGRPSLEVQNI